VYEKVFLMAIGIISMQNFIRKEKIRKPGAEKHNSKKTEKKNHWTTKKKKKKKKKIVTSSNYSSKRLIAIDNFIMALSFVFFKRVI
ncbi:hypothetical protein V6E16_23600, partial [Serratia marcescens]|uniref:hypothetical protein n=1 Tax=Serratia marcescens TaxID=615 RepID=UPI002FD91CAE